MKRCIGIFSWLW